MAMYATNRFPGDGTTTSYEFNFVGKYIARAHVKVYQEDNATKVRTYVSINDSNFLNDTTLRSLPVTPVGSTLVIYRETPKPPLVDFVNGSRFTEYNMDLVARQGLFVAMEAMDAGDAEARQQLLDAFAVIVGLSGDATAAALAAATSASNSAGSATLAQDAKVAAEAANSAAQTARSAAQASATAASASASNASTSASSASTSASNAAGSASSAAASASTASTQAGLAGGYAVSANTQANNASSSAATATTQAGIATTKAAEAANSATLAGQSAAAAAASAASINQADIVHISGTETITGNKTFSGAVVVPTNPNPSAVPTRAMNYDAARTSLVLNAWPSTPGVTNNVVYAGWNSSDARLVAKVDSTDLGTLQTSLSMASGKVGAHIFAHFNTPGSTIGYGSQIAGAALRPASPVLHQGTPMTGTWVCLGYCTGSTNATDPAAKTLFMRIA